MRDDEKEEWNALYDKATADGPLTQEQINTACRQLAADGFIEWDEANLRASMTPKGIATDNWHKAKKGLRRKRMN